VAVANVLDANSYVGFGAALGTALADVKPGKKSAYVFENIITPIIEYVFRNHFRSATIQPQFQIHAGRKRIDIKADCKTSSSLQTVVTVDNNLRSSFVPIECKNYSGTLGNQEFGQMVDRCDQRHRHFGILTCREAGDRARITEECHTRYTAHNYLIIVLDDSDLIQLLTYSDRSNDDKLVEYIEKRITEVRDLAP